MGTKIQSLYVEELDEYVDMAIEEDSSFYLVEIPRIEDANENIIEIQDYKVVE